MMIKRFGLCAAFIAFCMGSLSASSHPAPGQWEVSADFLYFMPSFDETYFVFNKDASSTFPSGKKENADFDFKPGFRVRGAHEFCDCDREISVSYARLSASHRHSITSEFLEALYIPQPNDTFVNYSGTAAADLDMLYQRFDVLLSQQLTNCCGVDFRFQFGLEGDELRLDETYTYLNDALVVDTTATVDLNSKTWAIGPEFGFDIDYSFFGGGDCECPGALSLHVNSTASLLAANTTHGNTSEILFLQTTTVLADFQNSSTWRVLPALHMQVGVNYDFSFSCFDLALEVGYEFNSYFRALARSVSDDVTEQVYDNFDLQGLYVSFAVRF